MADLARAIGINDRALRYMLAGQRPVSAHVEARVRDLLRQQIVDRAVALFEELRRQHGQPAEIVLTARDAGGEDARALLAAELRARGVTVTLA